MKRLMLIGLAAALMILSLALTGVSAQDGGSLDGTPLPPGATAAPLPTMQPRPAPSNTLTQGKATLEIYFQVLKQGQTGLLHVAGPTVTGARARWLNQLTDFFPVDGDGFYGLLSVDMEQRPTTYDLSIFVSYSDGTRDTINTQVQVLLGDFITQNVTLAADKGYLLDPDIERAELARLQSIYSGFTEPRMWDDTGFQMPIFSTLTSPFGAFRVFNQTYPTRHTGWDIRAALGTPIMACAAGTVVYAGPMDIRGREVVIDHGYGVFSAYSHFSRVDVTRGETVSKGQVLGLVGDVGRTTGPHFHWEIAVNGTWVDSVQFIKMWMP